VDLYWGECRGSFYYMREEKGPIAGFSREIILHEEIASNLVSLRTPHFGKSCHRREYRLNKFHRGGVGSEVSGGKRDVLVLAQSS